ncbi:MAG: hypothetical protein DHS20C14_07440 [Phycisphaeraceae bacterium]|nr:MAG: hypothetical protein DHS20C14_07440 [Phycisphaeraceae bacterium]
MNRNAQPNSNDPAAACPCDGTVMRKVDVEGVVVDRCPGCGGVWLDLGELAQLLGVEDAKTEIADLDPEAHTHAPASDTVRVCPRDGQRLTPVRVPQQAHIEYDLCTHCGGTFYDAGELRDLSRFTLAERVKSLLG